MNPLGRFYPAVGIGKLLDGHVYPLLSRKYYCRVDDLPVT